MANLIQERYIREQQDDTIQVGVDGGAAKIWEGAMVSPLLATGMAVRAGTALSGAVLGVSGMTVDNSAGNDGDLSVLLHHRKGFWFSNDGSDPATAADLKRPLYVVDDQTVSRSSAGGTRPIAGVCLGVDSLRGALVYIDAVANEALAAEAAELEALLMLPGTSLFAFREVDANGDVGAIAANGGVLASDTTPILRGDAAESQEINWAAGNTDKIAVHVPLPKGFDGTKDVTVDLLVSTGNTNADAATFVVETGWDGAALVSDTATDSSPSGTVHEVTATIAHADIPDSADRLTLILTPAAHATDDVSLHSVRVNHAA